MAILLVPPRCFTHLLFLLFLAMAGLGWCQTLLDPEPRTCRTQDNTVDASALSQGSRNEYPAGGVLMVLAKVPAGLFGSLEVYLCPDGEAEEECLDRVPLQLADGSGTSYNLQKVPRTDKYEIPVTLPDDITCSTCTLQLRVLRHACEDEEICPVKEETFCADVTVREIKSPKRRVHISVTEAILQCAADTTKTIRIYQNKKKTFAAALVEFLCSYHDQVITESLLNKISRAIRCGR